MNIANVTNDVMNTANKAKGWWGRLAKSASNSATERLAEKRMAQLGLSDRAGSTYTNKRGSFGFGMPALAGAGAVGALGFKAAYNKTEGESGGYGSSLLMGAMAGVGMYASRRPARFAQRMERFGKGRILGGLKNMGADDVVNMFGKAKKGSMLNYLSGKMGKGKMPATAHAINSMVGASSGAITGVAAGGVYGAFSDDETVLSGAFKGVMLGGSVGFFRGGGKRGLKAIGKYRENVGLAKGQLYKESGRLKSTAKTAYNMKKKAREVRATIKANFALKNNLIVSGYKGKTHYKNGRKFKTLGNR